MSETYAVRAPGLIFRLWIVFDLKSCTEPRGRPKPLIAPKHVPRYLAEFEYRFNRRYDLAAMLPRLTWAAVRTPPMPYRLLKLPDVYA